MSRTSAAVALSAIMERTGRASSSIASHLKPAPEVILGITHKAQKFKNVVLPIILATQDQIYVINTLS